MPDGFIRFVTDMYRTALHLAQSASAFLAHYCRGRSGQCSKRVSVRDCPGHAAGGIDASRPAMRGVGAGVRRRSSVCAWVLGPHMSLHPSSSPWRKPADCSRMGPRGLLYPCCMVLRPDSVGASRWSSSHARRHGAGTRFHGLHAISGSASGRAVVRASGMLRFFNWRHHRRDSTLAAMPVHAMAAAYRTRALPVLLYVARLAVAPARIE